MKTPSYASIVQFPQLVELKDYRGPTKKEYVRYLRKFAAHVQCDPATVAEDRLREYFLFLRQKQGYHSCNHRACPQCGHADATAWLARQRQKLLPVPDYLVTFTVPAQLRRLLRSHQRPLYGALLTQSARALQEVARDHKNFGAQVGILAVLQTWTRDLRFHPHVHCVVPAGGLSPDGLRWIRPKHPDYFLPQAALAMRLRTRFKAIVQKLCPQEFAALPDSLWTRDWVADVQPVGSGEPAQQPDLHPIPERLLPLRTAKAKDK